MNRAEYIDGVMGRLNELSWDDSSAGMFLGGDTSKVERHVEASFMDAWRRGVALLPRHYFNQASFVYAPLYPDIPMGTGIVELPLDFYVLASFRMEGWRKAVFMAVEENDAVEAVQSNEFVRGNVSRPVCTLAVEAPPGPPVRGVRRVLKYYSLPCGAEHVISEALYIALVGSLDSAVSSLDERLIAPLQWLNASVALQVVEKIELSKVAEERATLLIN